MDLCFNSYVYLEYPNEATVEEAVTNYKNVEMNGQILYVIKTVTEKKESFGESFELSVECKLNRCSMVGSVPGFDLSCVGP